MYDLVLALNRGLVEFTCVVAIGNSSNWHYKQIYGT
jgi:hypothetical protein